MGIPPALTYAAIATEVLGSLLLIAGFLGRFAALGVATLMSVAAWRTLEVMVAKGGPVGARQVIDGWMDNPNSPIGATYGSYHVLAVGVALALLIFGSGAVAVDRALSAASHRERVERRADRSRKDADSGAEA